MDPVVAKIVYLKFVQVILHDESKNRLSPVLPD